MILFQDHLQRQTDLINKCATCFAIGSFISAFSWNKDTFEGKRRNSFRQCGSTYQSLIDIFVIDQFFVGVVEMVDTLRDVATN